MSRFTKKAITEVFVALLAERPLDKITVRDIVDECGINRNTFYYYYQDIYALLEEVLRDEVRKILDSTSLHDSWQDAFLEAIRFALENRRAVYHVYNSTHREHLEQYFHEVIGSAMEDFVRDKAQGLAAPAEDLRILRDFYKFALSGIIFQWIHDGMQGEPAAAIQRLGVLLDGNIREALEKGTSTPV